MFKAFLCKGLIIHSSLPPFCPCIHILRTVIWPRVVVQYFNRRNDLLINIILDHYLLWSDNFICSSKWFLRTKPWKQNWMMEEDAHLKTFYLYESVQESASILSIGHECLQVNASRDHQLDGEIEHKPPSLFHRRRPMAWLYHHLGLRFGPWKSVSSENFLYLQAQLDSTGTLSYQW